MEEWISFTIAIKKIKCLEINNTKFAKATWEKCYNIPERLGNLDKWPDIHCSWKKKKNDSAL